MLPGMACEALTDEVMTAAMRCAEQAAVSTPADCCYGLALGAGSVIELAKAAGEPLDVLINGRPVARGEAVMVNEKFGVRLTEIVSPTERVERLR